MAKDFRATQIETTKIILSGGIGSQGVGGIIYSGSVATNKEGGIPASMLSDVGTDVFLFVSGTKTPNREDVTLFGGDVVISGTLYGGSPLTVGFDMHLSNSVGSTQYLNFGDTEGVGGYGFRSSAGTMQFRNNGGSWSNFGGGAAAGGSDVDWVDRGDSLVTTSSVSIAGGLGDTFEASNADSRAFTFFSGARAELGTLSAATTGLYAGTQTNVFFGGDVVFSGSLHGKSAVGGGATLFDATADDINFRKARQFIVANEAGIAPSSGPSYDGNVGFTVTGSIDSRGIPSAISGVSLFGGDLVVSGTMHTDHGVQRRFKILTAPGPYNVESNDHHIIVDVNGAFIINLPRADVAGLGREIYIKGKDQVSNSNYIDIVAYSGQYIDNAATFRITTPWTSVQLICDGGAGAGARWYIMSDGRV